MKTTYRNLLLVGLAAVSLSASVALAQTAPDGGWRIMARSDLDFLDRTLRHDYIYAAYPQPEVPLATFDTALQTARADLDKVKDFAGYRAALSHYIAIFNDAHLRLRFNLQPTQTDWAGFLVSYRGSRFVVADSQVADVEAGAVVESCDGRTPAQIAEERAAFESGVAGAESTKARFARTLMLDAKSPLYARPQRCVIAGKEIVLKWTSIGQDALAAITARVEPRLSQDVSIAPLGDNGAWVRMPTMGPNPAQAKQFHEIIRQAPSLRDKTFVVIDVRGNGGGAYNWSMAFLRGLYGPDYVDHYARERLYLRSVFAANDATAEEIAQANAAARQPDKDPLDTPPDLVDETSKSMTLKRTPDGQILELAQVAAAQRLPAKGKPPASPVKARVYVLTDYGCASACISFLDEMGNFPGVTRIGTNSYYDRRSGSPANIPLASGNGVVTVPVMIRENRRRPDQVELAPAIRFDGDINDTTAVQRWVIETVVPQGR